MNVPLPSSSRRTIISFPLCAEQTSIQDLQFLGIPKQSPPKLGGKHDPKLGPEIIALLSNRTEHPPFFLQR